MVYFLSRDRFYSFKVYIDPKINLFALDCSLSIFLRTSPQNSHKLHSNPYFQIIRYQQAPLSSLFFKQLNAYEVGLAKDILWIVGWVGSGLLAFGLLPSQHGQVTLLVPTLDVSDPSTASFEWSCLIFMHQLDPQNPLFRRPQSSASSLHQELSQLKLTCSKTADLFKIGPHHMPLLSLTSTL